MGHRVYLYHHDKNIDNNRIRYWIFTLPLGNPVYIFTLAKTKFHAYYTYI